VTLLLANAAAMEALPIVLDRISTPVVAIIVSVTLVLLFGEIIPQALILRFGLAVGANLAWFCRVLIFVTFFISWPISKLLDYCLGREHITRYKHNELKELVSMHSEGVAGESGALSLDESTIIRGALELREKTAIKSMTPLGSLFMLDTNDKLDRSTIKDILDTGHSRIPIYENQRYNIKGVLIVKRLLLVDPNESTPIKNVELKPLPDIPSDMPLYDLLNSFQEGKSHMCSVSDKKSKKVIGIITLEDVIEELIQEEIVDETDVYVDVAKRIQVSNFIDKLGKIKSSIGDIEIPLRKKIPPPPPLKKVAKEKYRLVHESESVSYDSDIEKK